MDWFLIDTMRYLNKHDFEVTLVCDMDENFIMRNNDFAKCIPINLKRGIDLRGSMNTFLYLYKLFKKEKFDIVQYFTPNAALVSSMAATLAKVPVRLYGQWGIRYVGFSGIKRKIFKAIEQITCYFSTSIEPDSKGNLRYAIEEGLYSKEKGSVVWNGSASGVNLNKYDITKKEIWDNEIREMHGISTTAFVIGFVGRITRDKGINELLSATKSILEDNSDVYLFLIGDEDEIQTIDNSLRQWSISEKRVKYFGKSNEVEKYLSAMNIFVLPSYREGFGTVVIEAEAMGVPVIVTDIPGPTEAMEENETGFVVRKSDGKDLEKTIRKALKNRDGLQSMGANGREFVTKNFDQKLLFQKILDRRLSLLELGKYE